MEKSKMLDTMLKKAQELLKNYTWEAWCELWDMCNEWNDTHEERIEMYETSDDDDNVNGFMIEDYCFYWE